MSGYPVVVIAKGIGVPRGVDDSRRHASSLTLDCRVPTKLDFEQETRASRAVGRNSSSNETRQG